MAIFLDLQRDAIAGTIGTFDRLIFKGHLNALFPRGAFKRYLDRRDILLKDAGAFFEAETARLKTHAKALADDSGRPFVYLNAAHTHAVGTSYSKSDNKITWVADVDATCQLCDSLTRTAWLAFLDRLAFVVNPLLTDL